MRTSPEAIIRLEPSPAHHHLHCYKYSDKKSQPTDDQWVLNVYNEKKYESIEKWTVRTDPTLKPESVGIIFVPSYIRPR